MPQQTCVLLVLFLALALGSGARADDVYLPIVGDEFLTGVTFCRVTGVHDGDTFYIDTDGDRVRDDTVRPIGWNAPEISWGVECYGIEAKRRAQALLQDQRVALEQDERPRDGDGRLLRYVYIISDTHVLWLGAEMVSGGYARVASYPPDVRYYFRLQAIEAEARAAKRGGWGACGW